MAKPGKGSKVPREQVEAAEQEIVDRARRIDFYTTEYTVELLVDKMKSGDFVIPDYQRKFTWEAGRKSRFIESLVMGLPIPFLFFWEMQNGKLEIVDGSQRLRTLQEYVGGDLKLSVLEELPSLSRTRFTDLLAARQRKILNRSIRGIVLNEHADDQARFDMFERINTGSKVANPAEVRRGALHGPFQDLVMELSQLPLLGELAPVSSKSEKERVHEELVTRFFAYGDGISEYRESPSRFTFEYTRKMNGEFTAHPELVDQYRARLISVLDFVKKNFPYGFRKIPNGNSTPRVRFEAIAIGSALALRDRPDLATGGKLNVLPWLEGEEFKRVTTSDAANVKSKLENRIAFVQRELLATDA